MAYAEIEKDLTSIVKLNKKCDYTNADRVTQVIALAKRDSLFQSVVGKRYIARIRAISDGQEHNGRCVICDMREVTNGVTCDVCVDKVNNDMDEIVAFCAEETENESLVAEIPEGILGDEASKSQTEAVSEVQTKDTERVAKDENENTAGETEEAEKESTLAIFGTLALIVVVIAGVLLFAWFIGKPLY